MRLLYTDDSWFAPDGWSGSTHGDEVLHLALALRHDRPSQHFLSSRLSQIHTSNIVEATGNIVAFCLDIVAGVDRVLLFTRL